MHTFETHYLTLSTALYNLNAAIEDFDGFKKEAELDGFVVDVFEDDGKVAVEITKEVV